MKLKNPYFSKTGLDSLISSRKKYAIRIRIAAARPVRPH
jgi:hypothetical protein